MATALEKVEQDKEVNDVVKDDMKADAQTSKTDQKDGNSLGSCTQSEIKENNEKTDQASSNNHEKGKTENADTHSKGSGDETVDEETEELDPSDTFNDSILNDGDRNKMFEEALKLDKEGEKNKALKCYLKCLVGLTERSQFQLLPQCLRNISDIYYCKDEYEKAISFIQAEKLFYESVLINETELQKQMEEISKEGEGANGDSNMNLLRASEYEQLSKLCIDEKQPNLALEYAGKATKLRQQVYGDEHPVVKESLNHFTALYAEAGKALYAENLKKYEKVGPPDLSLLDDQDGPSTPSTEPSSILRKRKNTESDREKRVRFDESQIPNEDVIEREEKMARTVLFLLFITLLIVIVILGIYIYCYLSPSVSCSSFKLTIRDVMMRAKYWYYYYISGGNNKYV